MAATEQMPKRPARVRLMAWVVAAAIAAGIAIAAVRTPSAEQRALSRMPPDERGEVYERAMENVKALCGQGPRTDALERECAEQIRFVLQFPECDDACRDIARMRQPRPTK